MKVDFTNVSKHYANKTYEQMKPVLMDIGANAPEIFYHMIRGNSDQGNVTILESGTVGTEYIKTVGHYHIGDLKETYYIKNGQGIALLQKLVINKSGKMMQDVVEEFRAIPFKEGDRIFMPGDGWGHVIVNTGSKYLVTIDDTIVYFDNSIKPAGAGYAEYDLVKNMRGFAYYVVEKDGNPYLFFNKKYREVRKSDFGGMKTIAS